ncbi:chromate efflux transporter [Archangium gephyra]|uniref:chromate efflux transporter n=1 Tax=Archangium gephyra TaxID=48 RepID=UPI0035D48EE6
MSQTGALRELALLFLRLGTTAFGGPAAHIAMMEDEVVRRRKWLTREEFLDLLGAANLIPGPNSTELAIHIGHRRAGWSGLVVAGTCFILPAFLIVSAIGWVYTRFGQLPRVGHVLYGVKPVIIAVVLQAIWGLARGAAKTKLLAAVGGVCVALGFLGVNELLLLVLAGGFVTLWRLGTRKPGGGGTAPPAVKALLPGLPLGGVVAATAAKGFSLGGLFLFFLKVGSILYGSGYVLLAFLRADLVERWGWLTEAQLLDAVAVGQVTPGPVFTTATFIGYVLGGPSGAVVATVGIFLPAFFFVAVSGPLVPRMRRSWVAGAFLDGVNVASLALMATVTWQLGRAALVDVWTVGLALASAVLLIRYRVNSAWLVLGGAVVGLLVG